MLEGQGGDAPVPIRGSRDAEHNAMLALRSLGFGGLGLTAHGVDDGVDVRGKDVVAQVKAEVAPVGLAVVQRLWGCAAKEHRKGAVFALAGYTPAAVRWADDVEDLALFVFDLMGSASPADATAQRWTLAATAAAEPAPVGGTADRVPQTWQELAAARSELHVGPTLKARLSVDAALMELCYQARLSRTRLPHVLLPSSQADPDEDEWLACILSRDLGTSLFVLPPDAGPDDVLTLRQHVHEFDVLFLGSLDRFAGDLDLSHTAASITATRSPFTVVATTTSPCRTALSRRFPADYAAPPWWPPTP